MQNKCINSKTNFVPEALFCYILSEISCVLSEKIQQNKASRANTIFEIIHLFLDMICLHQDTAMQEEIIKGLVSTKYKPNL